MPFNKVKLKVFNKCDTVISDGEQPGADLRDYSVSVRARMWPIRPGKTGKATISSEYLQLSLLLLVIYDNITKSRMQRVWPDVRSIAGVQPLSQRLRFPTDAPPWECWSSFLTTAVLFPPNNGKVLNPITSLRNYSYYHFISQIHIFWQWTYTLFHTWRIEK